MKVSVIIPLLYTLLSISFVEYEQVKQAMSNRKEYLGTHIYSAGVYLSLFLAESKYVQMLLQMDDRSYFSLQWKVRPNLEVHLSPNAFPRLSKLLQLLTSHPPLE